MIDEAVAFNAGRGLSSLGIAGIIVIIVGLLILWAIVSVPVWLAAKVVTGGKASFGSAMAATLLGPIVYFIVLFAADLFLGAIVGGSAFIWAFLLAFIAWLAVYKSSFQTGWFGALAIAVLAILVFLVLSALLSILFGITFLGLFPRLI
ncbi:MAG: hypothetical protein QW057_01195 [Candidatus Bathyarchaeia archaeon]